MPGDEIGLEVGRDLQVRVGGAAKTSHTLLHVRVVMRSRADLEDEHDGKHQESEDVEAVAEVGRLRVTSASATTDADDRQEDAGTA